MKALLATLKEIVAGVEQGGEIFLTIGGLQKLCEGRIGPKMYLKWEFSNFSLL